MKTLVMAAILGLALCIPTFAGEVPTVGVATPQPSPAPTQTASTSASTSIATTILLTLISLGLSR